MGRVYVRKTTRASWTEAAMSTAMEKVKSGQLGVNAASREYGIPSRTLRRHLATNSSAKYLGRNPALSREHERRLVLHIQALGKVGFAPNRSDVKKMAFAFAKKLGLKNCFSENDESAGKVWLNGFLKRNTSLSIRKSEGLSLARAQGMNRKEVADYFDLVLKLLTENDLLDKPSKIFNMDETGIQVNNKAERVVATKGSKDVYSLTSTEKGENISLIACCNAEGTFLPPVLIMKGKYKKPDFLDGLPPGSDVYMNQKTSYINSNLFIKWFREYFIPRKGTGNALLILDGHASHCNAIELLNLASENNVELLCLPSHTTQALQPLDRSFFKPLKTYFAQETRTWMINHKDRKLNRHNVSALIGKAWVKSASVCNAVSGFKATGIYPYDPSVIPEHFFNISDAACADIQVPSHEVLSEETATAEIFNGSASTRQPELKETPPKEVVPEEVAAAKGLDDLATDSQPEAKETPSKFLREIVPVPTIPINTSKRKQSAMILTSPENKVKRQVLSDKKSAKTLSKCSSAPSTSGVKSKTHSLKKDKRKRKLSTSSSEVSEDDSSVVYASSDEASDVDDTDCIECGEHYYSTKSKDDWIQCIVCGKWLHESCTMYLNICNRCGSQKKRMENKK